LSIGVLASALNERNTRILLGLSFDRVGFCRYHGALMSQQLPEQIDPFRLARQRRVITGELAVRRMKRLLPLISGADDRVANVALEFGTDDMGVMFVHGRVTAELDMTCQRCLQPMTQGVNAEFSLGLVTNRRDADLLPAHYDPLLVEQDHVPLLDIVEDELLLSLPIVAMHAEGACHAALTEQEDLKDTATRSSPFAVLEKLRPRAGGDK
jgi:uncharacterized protein